jgi:hypothetical protein
MLVRRAVDRPSRYAAPDDPGPRPELPDRTLDRPTPRRVCGGTRRPAPERFRVDYAASGLTAGARPRQLGLPGGRGQGSPTRMPIDGHRRSLLVRLRHGLPASRGRSAGQLPAAAWSTERRRRRISSRRSVPTRSPDRTTAATRWTTRAGVARPGGPSELVDQLEPSGRRRPGLGTGLGTAALSSVSSRADARDRSDDRGWPGGASGVRRNPARHRTVERSRKSGWRR